jgi:hypothetical protein
MEYYSIVVPHSRTAEYSLYLTQNYIMPSMDYTLVPASIATVEYRFKRYDHFLQFISRWKIDVQ